MAASMATEITKFSNFDSSSTSIAVGLDRKSTVFSHEISLILGRSTIATWTGSAANFTGEKSLSLTTSQRNTLLARLPTRTNGVATLKVITKNSYGDPIGTTTRTALYLILDAVKPTISNVGIEIDTPTGAISDRTRSYAIQNISTVKIGYTPAAPYGTTISSATVKLGDAAATSSNPGSFVPTESGSVPYTITVTDARKRVTTASGSVPVTAYEGMAAQLVHIQRPQGANEAQDKMTVRVRLTVPAIEDGGLTTNGFNVKITSTPVDGSSGTSTPFDRNYVYATANNTLYDFNPSMVYLETKAYDVTIVVKDDFKTVTLAGRLSTASFPLVLAPDGVGIGKIPEAGRTLDVLGKTYFDGVLCDIPEMQAYMADGDATTAKHLIGDDTRDDNFPPSEYMNGGSRYEGRAGWQTEFKRTASIGVGGFLSGTYCFLETKTPWSDSSGGYPIQIAYGDGRPVFRVGITNTTWGGWGYFVNKSDVGLSNVDNLSAASIRSGTTKADVGLSSVLNYGIATQTEAQAGTSNVKYTTPLRVKQAIDANKEIAESGSNENGEYIKFDDGTMICYAKFIISDITANGVATKTWYFPSYFKSGTNPIVTVTGGTSSGSMANGAKISSGLAGGLPSYQVAYAAVQNTDTSTRDIGIFLTAIGRWK